MVLDINWSQIMLRKLSKKLHILFIFSIMFIITFIIGLLCVNEVKTTRLNDAMFFQRMSLFLTRGLEESNTMHSEIIEDYEQRYGIEIMLKSEDGQILYRSDVFTEKEVDANISTLQKQITRESVSNNEYENMTLQGGLSEFHISNATYLATSSIITRKDGHVCEVVLLQKQAFAIEILQSRCMFYISVWILSLLCVCFVCHWLLKKAMLPTERMMKSQKDFIASASHELKAPLAVILASVDNLASQTSDEHIQKSIYSIDSECMRLSTLVKDMLMLASSDANTWTLHQSDVNVDTLLIRLYEAFQPMCADNKINLQLDIQATYPVLHTDEERIYQILSIYLDNAIQHSKHNHGIQIVTRCSTKSITFSIVDHGQGIGEKDKPFIFNRFYCIDKARTNKAHFGLGLSIAKELAQMLQGEVGMEDTIDGGATFYVTLPIRK